VKNFFEQQDDDETFNPDEKKYSFKGRKVSLRDFLSQTELNSNKNLTASILCEHGWAMSCVNSQLKADKELALIATKNCAEAYEYLDASLQK